MAIGRVNTGGGGKLFAIIAVTYPEGSICTCVSGTKTLKAKDTSGKALFNVPSAGTWTVSITDGSKTTSKTVNISTYGQIESVTLGYGGNVISAIGSFNEVRANGTGGITVSADGKTTATTTGTTSSSQGNVMYFSDVLFDLSKYSRLEFTINASIHGLLSVGFYRKNTSPYYWESDLVAHKLWNIVLENIDNSKFSVDLSAVTDNCYFAIGLSGYLDYYDGGTTTAILSDVNLYE